ncbi:MAG TPA: PA14 domain-containing protein [Kofleriaceae bacterium]|nr:PA14 domain-containing protein [Kofleriaceae bacterium]
MVERSSIAVALASGALLAACYGPNAPLGAPCQKETDCPTGQSCDPETSTCGPPSGFTTWLDDSAENFTAPGADTLGVEIEPAGFVGPVGYLMNGIRISGVNDIAVRDAGTTWTEVAALARTGTSFVRAADIDIADGEIPAGTGLNRADGISLIVEGEIRLATAGDWVLELSTDERSFLDVAPPGGAQFERVVTSAGGKASGPYKVEAAGWYRFRGAISDVSGNIYYGLRAAAPNQTNPRDVDPSDLRARASDLQGSFVDGFEDAFLLRPMGTAVVAETLGRRMLADDPFGIPVGNNSYSLRFASQVLIDVEGSYVLRVESTQGHRAFIDGVLASDISQWDDNSQLQVSRPAAQLEPGWHDLVVDLNREDNPDGTVLDVVVESGPAWAGQPIPVDHMRPVVPRSARWSASSSTFTTTISETAATTRGLGTHNVPGAAANRIDVVFTVSHATTLSQLSARFNLGNGGQQTIFSAGPSSLTSRTYHIRPAPSTSGGSPWGIVFNDTTADAMVGQVTFAAISVQGTFGTPPFPDSYSYTSAPRELGNVESFAYVRWGLRQARPDTVAAVFLRTCDTAAACDGEPWTPVALGAEPGVTPRRFAQYRIEVAGGGDVPTALDWIEIAYRSADKK